MQTESESGWRPRGPAVGRFTARVGQPLASTSTCSAVPRILRRRSLSRENTVTCWSPTCRVSATVAPTAFTPIARGESNQKASAFGRLPSAPHDTQRWSVIAGRPTKPDNTEEYDASWAGESTSAWLLPHAPRCRGPAKYSDSTGAAPQPHVSGTWTCTPAYDSWRQVSGVST